MSFDGSPFEDKKIYSQATAGSGVRSYKTEEGFAYMHCDVEKKKRKRNLL